MYKQTSANKIDEVIFGDGIMFFCFLFHLMIFFLNKKFILFFNFYIAMKYVVNLCLRFAQVKMKHKTDSITKQHTAFLPE